MRTDSTSTYDRPSDGHVPVRAGDRQRRRPAECVSTESAVISRSTSSGSQASLPQPPMCPSWSGPLFDSSIHCQHSTCRDAHRLHVQYVPVPSRWTAGPPMACSPVVSVSPAVRSSFFTVSSCSTDVARSSAFVTVAESSVAAPLVVRVVTELSPAPSAFVTVAEFSVAAPLVDQRPELTFPHRHSHRDEVRDHHSPTSIKDPVKRMATSRSCSRWSATSPTAAECDRRILRVSTGKHRLPVSERIRDCGRRPASPPHSSSEWSLKLPQPPAHLSPSPSSASQLHSSTASRPPRRRRSSA